MTCFSAACNVTYRGNMDAQLTDADFIFAASLPITVIPNIGTEGKRDAGYTEYRKSKKARERLQRHTGWHTRFRDLQGLHILMQYLAYFCCVTRGLTKILLDKMW